MDVKPRCPEPRCCGGRITRSRRRHPPTDDTCPVCGGLGYVDERARDLWEAGIVVCGATEEDFRSAPTLQWRGAD